jgi:CHASE2 domain-containing sensor protein
MARAGTRVIGFDVIFDIPSARGAADDEAFGIAIARAGNVVLATASIVDVQPGYVRDGYLVAIASIRRGAAALGVATTSSEGSRRADVRDRSHFATTSGRPELTFAAQIARLAADGAPSRADRPVLVNFRGPPGTFRRISYERIVRDAVADGELRGAIVLVGTTDRAVPDHTVTPFARSGTMPGVEIHANVVETLLRGNAIREVPRAVSAAAALVAGFVAGGLVAWYPGRAVELTLALLVLAAATTYALFVCCDVWFRFAGPGLALSAGLVLSIVARTRLTVPSA